MSIDRGHGIATSSVLADSYDLDGIIAKYEQFADTYLGHKAVEPTTDDDGDALIVGALYFNTVDNELRVYDGTDWQAVYAGALKVNNFTGDGATVAYTLTTAPNNENSTQVYIDGVYQQKDTYTTVGAVLTFSEAPPTNAGIEVMIISSFEVSTADAQNVTYSQGGTGSVSRTVENKLQESVSVKDFGAVGDGVTDDTAAIQAAIDASQHVIIPDGYTFVVSAAANSPCLIVGAESTLEINGILLLAPSTPDGVCMISNRDAATMATDMSAAGYLNNITICGTGKIDGNKSNQTTGVEIRHSCVQLWKGSHYLVSVNEISQNKWDNAYTTAPTSNFSSCVGMIDVRYSTIKDVLLYSWEHEGITMDDNLLTTPRSGDCHSNTITGCICDGYDATNNDASYSGIQLGSNNAYNNTISNCIVRNCGASGIGLDSQHSSISNCTVYRNGYFHGINLGHTDAVASYSTVSNCSLYDIGDRASASYESNGIMVGNGTTNVVISNCNIDTAYDSGISLSVATDCAISNCRVDNAGDHGFKLNVADGTKISNCIVKNQGGSLLSDVGTPSANLEYHINETTVLESVKTNTIVFPATQVPSSNANTLDDYEEGSWTPTIVGSSVAGTPTYTTQVGFYEKIGRLVNFRCRVTLSSMGGISGNITIEGLPVNSNSTASSYGASYIAHAAQLSITAGQNVTGVVNLNSDSIGLKHWDVTTGSSELTQAELTNYSQFFVSGQYMV